jgi:glutamine synthetase
MFDGSSIEGWKAINESDMILKPDLDSVYVDPFSAVPMLIINCDIVEPSTGELYARDPRSTAKRAEAFLKSTGIGDTIYVGPEAGILPVRRRAFYDGYDGNGFKIDDIELPTNSNKEYEAGNLAHRPRAKGGYFPVARSTASSTSAAKWSRPCSKWACPATSTTTKWPPPSTNWA